MDTIHCLIGNGQCIIYNVGEYEVSLENGNLILKKTDDEIKNKIKIVEIVNTPNIVDIPDIVNIPDIPNIVNIVDIVNIPDIVKYTFESMIKNIKQLAHSTIFYCKINEKVCQNVKNWRQILISLYESIDDIELILKHTTLNIVEKNEHEHYTYCEQLGVSMQNVNTSAYFFEIYNIIKLCGVKIKIKIEKQNKQIIQIKDDFRTF
jgi:hypothetical protein